MSERLDRCEALDKNDLAGVMECARCITPCTSTLMACEESALAPERADESALAPPGDAGAPAGSGLTGGPATCSCACEAMVDESQKPACSAQCAQTWVPCVTTKDFPPPSAVEIAELRDLLKKKGLSPAGIENYENVLHSSPPAIRKIILRQFQ